MNIPSAPNTTTILPSADNSAAQGIRTQEQRFERNVAEVARNEDTQTRDSSSQDRALVEQGEIVQAVRANARSLEAANQRIGTLVDIKV
jgi:hypothetical protein